MSPYRLASVAALTLLVTACGGGADPAAESAAPAPAPSPAPAPTPEPPPPAPSPPAPPPVADTCALPQQEGVVSAAMSQLYFWNKNLATPDASASTVSDYFDSLLYRPVDHYSFSEPTTTFDQRTNLGIKVGYGYTLTWDDAAHTVMRVRNVEALGPAAQAGLRRGDVVVSIDGHGLADIAAGIPVTVTEPGVARRFVVHRDGADVALDMTSAEYKVTVVPKVATFDVVRGDGSTAKVGYLAYQSFVDYGSRPVGEAMRRFAREGVTQLVLDLRYNGGGSVTVSRDLASMIGGPLTAFQLFVYLRFNPLQVVNNRPYLFQPVDAQGLPGPSLKNPQQLVVITSSATASASELVINGLKPFMPVTLVGSTTYGKPFGSVVKQYCGTTYHAIQFTTLNAKGQGDYANGIAADCEVADDLDHELGDPEERRLKASLQFIGTGACPVASAQSVPRKAAAPKAFGDVEPKDMYVQ